MHANDAIASRSKERKIHLLSCQQSGNRRTVSSYIFIHFCIHFHFIFLPSLFPSPPFLHQLRLLYEGNPMAYIIEKAGGLASTGKMAILDVQPQQIHERVPVFMGSSEDVQELLAFHQQN